MLSLELHRTEGQQKQYMHKLHLIQHNHCTVHLSPHSHTHIFMQDHTRRVSILHIYFYDRFIQEFFILDIFHVRQQSTTSTQKKLWLTRKSNSQGFSPYMPTWIIILKLIICLYKLLGFLALLPIRAGHRQFWHLACNLQILIVQFRQFFKKVDKHSSEVGRPLDQQYFKL